jgi:hypothetical protein
MLRPTPPSIVPALTGSGWSGHACLCFAWSEPSYFALPPKACPPSEDRRMMYPSLRALLLIATTLYQASACWLEDQQALPGQRIDVGGLRLHLWVEGQGSPTIVLDHSLGGVEGYLLMEELAQLTRACIYGRAGYGWSDQSRQPRSSKVIVEELDLLLTRAGIAPPVYLGWRFIR